MKEQITNLENKILSLVGMVDIESSGGEKKNVLNDNLLDLINSTSDQLNVVAPHVDSFYAKELKRTIERGIPVLLITNDRSTIPREFIPVYDELKSLQGISIVNNPNVRFLLVFNTYYHRGEIK